MYLCIFSIFEGQKIWRCEIKSINKDLVAFQSGPIVFLIMIFFVIFWMFLSDEVLNNHLERTYVTDKDNVFHTYIN